jgi:hypothetical protein
LSPCVIVIGSALFGGGDDVDEDEDEDDAEAEASPSDSDELPEDDAEDTL